nr:MAG TPA: hypothetical protein [Caudoviricetes sp.]
MPNSVPGFLDRWDCNEKSVMTAYIVPVFRGIPPAPPALRRFPSGLPLCSVLLGPTAGGGAVRRRPGPVRYRFPTSPRGLPDPARPDPPAQLGPSQGRSGSQGSPRFLRVLPGFSPAVPPGM